ncbi:MAG: ABC transporter ATP-binding protein [Acidobacteriota bacterium]
MIRVRDLGFQYGQTVVLDGVEADFDRGLHLVLGPNGCGKSTLLRLVAGIEVASRGRITLDGFDLWTDEIEARKSLTYVPEHPDLTPFATLREVVRLVARLRGRSDTEADAALEKLGIGDLHRRTVRELSLGQRRRAMLATARIATPRYVLLDEPLDALDRRTRAEVIEWIDSLVNSNHCVLVISHDLAPFAERPAHAGFLEKGRWNSAGGRRTFSLDELDRLARAKRIDGGESSLRG